MTDVIHIHEDHWGMRNLYPLSVRAAVEAEIDKASEAARRNKDPSGLGYTAVHAVEPPAQGYADTGLTLLEAERVLAPIMPRVRRFNATILSAFGSPERDPLGAYEEDAWCFGLGAHCYLKLDAKGALVGAIWFDLSTVDADAATRLRQAIEAIDQIAPSVIADYFLHFSAPVSEPGVLDTYFNALAEQCRQMGRAMSDYRQGQEQPPQRRGLLRKLFEMFGGKP